MTKLKIKKFPYLIPNPVALIGAIVNKRVNFITIADLCTTGYKIPRFVISSGKGHFTNEGIIKNEEFSVNIPSTDMVNKVDYCGIKTGHKVDKSSVFEIFYGQLQKAPMIKIAPITHECKLVKTIDFGDTHYLFIGEIIGTYVEEDLIENNIPKIEEIKPFSYYYDNYYWKNGERLAEAYKVGKEIN